MTLFYKETEGKGITIDPQLLLEAIEVVCKKIAKLVTVDILWPIFEQYVKQIEKSGGEDNLCFEITDALERAQRPDIAVKLGKLYLLYRAEKDLIGDYSQFANSLVKVNKYFEKAGMLPDWLEFFYKIAFSPSVKRKPTLTSLINNMHLLTRKLPEEEKKEQAQVQKCLIARLEEEQAAMRGKCSQDTWIAE